jgi:hypothetical protein
MLQFNFCPHTHNTVDQRRKDGTIQEALKTLALFNSRRADIESFSSYTRQFSDYVSVTLNDYQDKYVHLHTLLFLTIRIFNFSY